MDFNKCLRVGCKNENCNYTICDIGNICKSCQSDFREYLLSKFPNYNVDNNYFPEKIFLKEIKIFMTKKT